MCISAADEPGAVSNADSLARMEFYMKKAAQEEKMRQPKQSKDEMPPPASLQGSFFIFTCDCYLVFLGLVYIRQNQFQLFSTHFEYCCVK